MTSQFVSIYIYYMELGIHTESYGLLSRVDWHTVINVSEGA
jgi:hypothetical protein